MNLWKLIVNSVFYGMSAASVLSAVFVSVSGLGWFATTVAVLNALSVILETVFYELDRRRMNRLKKEAEELRQERLKDFN